MPADGDAEAARPSRTGERAAPHHSDTARPNIQAAAVSGVGSGRRQTVTHAPRLDDLDFSDSGSGSASNSD